MIVTLLTAPKSDAVSRLPSGPIVPNCSSPEPVHVILGMYYG